MTQIILPGDPLPLDPEINVTLGPGLYKTPKSQTIIPVNAGELHVQVNRKQTNQVVYIDLDTKRYIPQTNDLVIGVVTGVLGENYKVCLQDFSTPVMLPMMAFPNATKKNRPNLTEGDAVYARVASAIPELETELLCVDARTGKEGGFGLLGTAGFVFEVKQSFARELLFNAQSIFLEKLALRCQFEIAVGINGKIWLKCGDGLVEKPVQGQGQGQGQDDENAVKPPPSTSSIATPKNELNEKDLRATIAAAKFLIRCQQLDPSNIDQILTESLKGL